MALNMQSTRRACSATALGRGHGARPVYRHHMPCSRAGTLPPSITGPLNRGLSMLCRMVHGGSSSNSKSAATPAANEAASTSAAAAAAAPAVDELPSQPSTGPVADPLEKQAAHNSIGHAFIKVVGVGGGGGNAIGRMMATGLQGVEMWVVNTDAQALDNHACPNKLQIGRELTRGLGTGGKSELGEQAAQESVEELSKVVAGADLLFVTAGMGGGTGTGAAPVIARLAKDAGVLTVGVVTYPFNFEGRRRGNVAVDGIETLRRNVDTLIVIPNDKLLEAVGDRTSLTDAFGLADDVLRQGVGGISDIITTPGLINVDFADIKSVMHNSGTAMLGLGMGTGKNRAAEAAYAATSATLIQNTIERATGIVYNITGSSNLTLHEVTTISEHVLGLADPTCNIIFGAVVNDEMCAEDEIHVTIIATGFSQTFEEQLLAGKGTAKAAAAASSNRAAAGGWEAEEEAPRRQQQQQQQGWQAGGQAAAGRSGRSARPLL